MNNSKGRFCLACDLNDKPNTAEHYIAYHNHVWPEVIENLRESGIDVMQIYHTGNRLFMIIETNDSFSFEKKKELDNANSVVQKWENLMLNYQQPLPHAKPGEKWMLMEKIFELN